MQLEFFDVPSPCVGVCQSDDKGQCKGCYRKREERQNWIEKLLFNESMHTGLVEFAYQMNDAHFSHNFSST